MNRVIDQIQTFDTIFFTGVGDLGKTVNDSRYQKVNKFPVTLEETPNGIEVRCYNKFILIPWAALKAVTGRMDQAKPATQQSLPIKVKADTSAENS